MALANRLILHVGMPKTGTTSLQESLLVSRDVLERAGFAVLAWKDRGNFSVLAQLINTRAPWRNSITSSKDLDRLEIEISDLITKSREEKEAVIISSEHLGARLTTQPQLLKLRIFLSSFFDQIDVVCYFREQARVLPSMWSQGLKAECTLGLEDFVDKKLIAPNLNYVEVANRWAQTFGYRHCNFRLFVSDSSWSITADFEKAVGIPTLSAGTKANKSLSLEEARVLLALNRLWPFLRRKRRLAKKIAAFAYGRNFTPVTLPEEAENKIRERFRVSNEQLFETFAPSGFKCIEEAWTLWSGARRHDR